MHRQLFVYSFFTSCKRLVGYFHVKRLRDGSLGEDEQRNSFDWEQSTHGLLPHLIFHGLEKISPWHHGVESFPQASHLFRFSLPSAVPVTCSSQVSTHPFVYFKKQQFGTHRGWSGTTMGYILGPSRFFNVCPYQLRHQWGATERFPNPNDYIWMNQRDIYNIWYVCQFWLGKWCCYAVQWQRNPWTICTPPTPPKKKNVTPTVMRQEKQIYNSVHYAWLGQKLLLMDYC